MYVSANQVNSLPAPSGGRSGHPCVRLSDGWWEFRFLCGFKVQVETVSVVRVWQGLARGCVIWGARVGETNQHCQHIALAEPNQYVPIVGVCVCPF